MDTEDFCALSVEQEEYLVELLCTRGACTLDWFAHEQIFILILASMSPSPCECREFDHGFCARPRRVS